MIEKPDNFFTRGQIFGPGNGISFFFRKKIVQQLQHLSSEDLETLQTSTSLPAQAFSNTFSSLFLFFPKLGRIFGSRSGVLPSQLLSCHSGLIRITRAFLPLFFFLRIVKQWSHHVFTFLSPQLTIKFLLKTPFSQEFLLFFQLATGLGHFSTAAQLLLALGLASGSHPGQQLPMLCSQ